MAYEVTDEMVAKINRMRAKHGNEPLPKGTVSIFVKLFADDDETWKKLQALIDSEDDEEQSIETS